jgi:hypothetical protein
MHLQKNNWAIVYGSKDYDLANVLFENLLKAAGGFGIKVEEPQWVEVPDSKTAQGYNDCIKSDINPSTCKIVCVIIFNPDMKKGVKKFLDMGGVPSQFITSRKLAGRP